MPEPVWEFPLRLPRNAFSPREVARAGDLWRAFQDAAVEASSRAGWPPARYRAAGTFFIVREIIAAYHREIAYGEPLTARTWVSRNRRDTLSTREVRLVDAAGPVASATQEWVHITADLKPTRAGADLISCFPGHEGGPSIELPARMPATGRMHTFEFECWHTWMDPLGHVNHPVYVDWADEAHARVVARAGIDPVAVVATHDRVVYRQGVVATNRVRIESTLAATTGAGDVVMAHKILRADGVACADVTTFRRLAPGVAGDLLAAVA